MVVTAGGLLYRLVMFLLATHLLNTQIYYYQLLPLHSVTGCFTVSTVSSVSIFSNVSTVSNLYDRHVAISLTDMNMVVFRPDDCGFPTLYVSPVSPFTFAPSCRHLKCTPSRPTAGCQPGIDCLEL